MAFRRYFFVDIIVLSVHDNQNTNKRHSLMDLRHIEEERLDKLVKMTTRTCMQNVHKIEW